MPQLIGREPNQVPVNQYLGRMAFMDSLGAPLAPGAGITLGSGTIQRASFVNEDGMERITILVNLVGLKGGGAAGDIIGSDSTSVNSAKQPAFIAQIPSNFTCLGGRMTCLRAPAGGHNDFDLYVATEGTGLQDDPIANLTETELINAGAQSTGTVTFLAADPAPGGFLYLVSQGTTTATYTAGRVLIELFGY